MVGLPRLDGRPGLQAPILEGCHPSLMSLWSKGPEGGPGEPGLAGTPEPREDIWHNWRESSPSPGPDALTAGLP